MWHDFLLITYMYNEAFWGRGPCVSEPAGAPEPRPQNPHYTCMCIIEMGLEAKIVAQ